MAYLERGDALSNKLAIAALGIGSLSSRVAELRKMGYPITDTIDTESDPYGRVFKKYRLEKEA